MVDLVARRASGHIGIFGLKWLSRAVESFYRYLLRPYNMTRFAGAAQAAFDAVNFALLPYYLRVYERDKLFIVVNYNHAAQYSDLRRGKAKPLRLDYGFK